MRPLACGDPIRRIVAKKFLCGGKKEIKKGTIFSPGEVKKS